MGWFLYHLFLYHRKSWLNTCYHTNLATVSVWGPHLATLIHHTLLTALWQRFSCEDIFSIVLQLSQKALQTSWDKTPTTKKSGTVHGNLFMGCITVSPTHCVRLYLFILMLIGIFTGTIPWNYPNFTDFTDPLVIHWDHLGPISEPFFSTRHRDQP